MAYFVEVKIAEGLQNLLGDDFDLILVDPDLHLALLQLLVIFIGDHLQTALAQFSHFHLYQVVLLDLLVEHLHRPEVLHYVWVSQLEENFFLYFMLVRILDVLQAALLRLPVNLAFSTVGQSLRPFA